MKDSTILIVEDEALVADDLDHRLTRLGYRVVGVEDTAERALDRAREVRPALVLSDIQLKGQGDGTDAAANIYRELGIPVVFLTSHSDEQTLKRAKASSPFGYIIKPYTEANLRTSIEVALERHHAERRVKRAEALLAATLRSIGDAVIATDAAGSITFMNPVAETLTGYSAEDNQGRDLSTVFLTYDPVTLRVVESPVVAALKQGETIRLERDITLVGFGGVHRCIEDSCSPIRDERGAVMGGILVFRDVSERKQREQERERLIAELKDALANVKTLSGLLPICAWCKSIRDDQGYWQRVEEYIKLHSTATFTHGICTTCFDKHIPKPDH